MLLGSTVKASHDTLTVSIMIGTLLCPTERCVQVLGFQVPSRIGSPSETLEFSERIPFAELFSRGQHALERGPPISPSMYKDDLLPVGSMGHLSRPEGEWMTPTNIPTGTLGT